MILLEIEGVKEEFTPESDKRLTSEHPVDENLICLTAESFLYTLHNLYTCTS